MDRAGARIPRLPRIPWVTLGIAAIAIIACLQPSLGDALQLRRGVTAADGWRCFTGHLSHWSFEQLRWDLLGFALLAAWLERRDRWRLVAALAASSLAIALVFLAWQSELSTYRGLSGIDWTLFTLVAIDVSRDRRSRPVARGAALLTLLLLGVKLGFESLTGQTLLVDAEFTPVPLAHAVGAVVGALLAIAWPAGRGSGRPAVHRSP